MKFFFNVFALCLTLAIGLLVFSCGDICKNVECGTHGTCSEADGKCECAAGYETNSVDKCDSLMRAKFLVSFSVHDECIYPTGGPFNYNISITESSAGIDKVTINNYGGYLGLNVLATVSYNAISINADNYTVNGHTYGVKAVTGTLVGTSFTLSYKVDLDGAAASDCIAVYTKL